MPEDHFDFQQIDEESEKLNFDKLTPCPNCKKPIPEDSTMCLYCGEEGKEGKKPTWFIWTAILVIVIFGIFILLST